MMSLKSSLYEEQYNGGLWMRSGMVGSLAAESLFTPSRRLPPIYSVSYHIVEARE